MSQRTKRRKSSTGLYHVFVRGINREQIFGQDREKQYFKKIIIKHLEKYSQYGVEIHAYCIMSNHAHLVIRVDEKNKLSYFMSNILAEYAQYYNYKHKRNGHVFQNRFGSECIEDEGYYWNCIKYVHMNPVKAFIVPTALDYKYSSLMEYKKGKLRLIHPNAYNLYRERFVDLEKFLLFHNITDTQMFLGMSEEVYAQKQEIALNILWNLKEKENLEEILRIFEEPELREIYQQRIKDELELSKRETGKLYTDIKNKYIV